MRRRKFLSHCLGAVGFTGLLETTALAQQGKPLRMVKPTEGAFLLQGISYAMSVTRRNRHNYPRIERIEFRWMGRLITTLTEEPYNYSWVPTSADIGQDHYTATAFQRGTGNVVWTKSVLMRVAFVPPSRAS